MTGMDVGEPLLWITQRYPPMGGGMAESARRHVEGLRRGGRRVGVVVIQSETARSAVKTHERDNGREWLVSAPDTASNAIQRAWHEVLLRHRDVPYALVAGFGCNLPGHIACTFAAWLGIPAVTLVRGNDFDRDWFDPRRQALVSEALSRAAAIGCVTHEKIDKIGALFPGVPCTWTPNGVEPDYWASLPADTARTEAIRSELGGDGRRVVGIVGELKYKKRVPLWLEAVRTQGLMEHIGLLLVGRLSEEVRQIVTDPALTPRCRLEDFVSRGQLPSIYRACDFTVIPSLFEGFPNVLLESMACGVIPICSTAGAMGDVLVDGETGFLFEAEDLHAAGEATRRALELDDAQVRAMQSRVREYVMDTFSAARELDALEHLFDAALTRSDTHARG